MRCFVAIGIGDHLREAIALTVESWRKSDADIRWVAPTAIHLTLKFLGGLDERFLDEMKKTLQDVALSHRRFDVRVRGVGVFPDFSRPRVIWVGVDVSEQLRRLYEGLDAEMERFGCERATRPFKPHLTVGRIKSRNGLSAVLQGIRGCGDREFGTIEVREILLMESVLKPSGAEYRMLSAAPFGKEV